MPCTVQIQQAAPLHRAKPKVLPCKVHMPRAVQIQYTMQIHRAHGAEAASGSIASCEARRCHARYRCRVQCKYSARCRCTEHVADAKHTMQMHSADAQCTMQMYSARYSCIGNMGWRTIRCTHSRGKCNNGIHTTNSTDSTDPFGCGRAGRQAADRR